MNNSAVIQGDVPGGYPWEMGSHLCDPLQSASLRPSLDSGCQHSVAVWILSNLSVRAQKNCKNTLYLYKDPFLTLLEMQYSFK